MLETNAKVYFGLIPKENWVQPAWIDEEKAEESRKRLTEQKVIYGGAHPIPILPKRNPELRMTGSSSYRNMCRFNSGVSVHCLLCILNDIGLCSISSNIHCSSNSSIIGG